VGSYQVVGGTFVFSPPVEFPGLPSLLVEELEVEPFDPASPDGDGVTTLTSTPNTYTAAGARVTATYRSGFDADNDPREDLPTIPNGTYLTYDADLAAEYLATPGRVWNWVDPPNNPPVPDDVNPGLLLPQGSFRLTWHRVARPPWSTIRSLRGKVNAATFVGAPAGTVLFLGARATRKFQFIEHGGFWKLEYAFQENTKELSTGAKVGWNHFYKETAVAGEHWVAIEDADGNPPYEAADLTPLFLFG